VNSLPAFSFFLLFFLHPPPDVFHPRPLPLHQKRGVSGRSKP